MVSVSTSLEPTQGTVAPGAGAATFTVKVRNNSDTVEEYQLGLVGPLSRWGQLSMDKLRLFPGDEGSTTLTIKVPRSPEVLAGPTPFGIRMVPREHPELSDVVEGTLTVTPYGELRAEMRPVTVRGRLSGLLRFSVTNRGNAPVDVRLLGTDDEDILRFEAGEEPTRVPAGVTGAPVLKVRSRRWNFTGKPRRYPFSVTVSPAEEARATGAQPTQLRGTYVHVALVPKWLLILLILALVLGAIASILWATGVPSLVFPQLAVPQLSLPQLTAPQLTPPNVQVQQQPPPQTQQSQGDQNQNQNQQNGNGSGDGTTTVTITHGNTALAAVTDQRSGGDPVPASVPANTGSRNQRSWSLVPLQDGSFVVLPVAAKNRALDEPSSGSSGEVDLTPTNLQQVTRTETWRLRAVSQGNNSVVMIVNSATGDCLTDAGSGRQVQAQTCQDQSSQAQIWQLDTP